MIPARLRDMPNLVPGALERVNDKSIPTFELQRGGTKADPEFEWLINGLSFDPPNPAIAVKRDSGAVWRIRNGGGGWVHPLHLHQEEHHVLARNGRPAPDARHPDDTGKEDVVALDPGEDVVIARRFRTFTGAYVAHCHNLTHEDHSMDVRLGDRPVSVGTAPPPPVELAGRRAPASSRQRPRSVAARCCARRRRRAWRGSHWCRRSSCPP